MNGQENDDEITGNRGTHTSAEYWEYDTRLGRRWNIDPIVKPWEAPYACFNNNPILFADPKGLDGEDRAKKYAAKNGGTVSKGSNGKSYVDGLSAGEGEYGTASKEFGDRWYEKAGKSIGNFFSKAADVVSNGDFKASVTGKVTFGIQAKLQAGMGKYLGAEINLNLAKVDIVKSNLNLSKPNKGDWSYKSDWNHVGENGGAHISQDARLGLDIAQYPVLEGYYKNDFDLDGLNAVEGSTKSNYGVSVVVPLIKKKTASDVEMMTVTDAAKAMGYMKNPAMKNPKSIQGEKEFYGIDVGAGAALFLGVDLNIKIGFESK